MAASSESLGRALVAACLVWHAVAVGQAWQKVDAGKGGTDFASYYYAADAAFDGADPYNGHEIAARADAHGHNATVHPYFYPPPFLLSVAWTKVAAFRPAYRLWFWLNEIALLISAGTLISWLRPLGSAVPVVAGLAIAATTGVADNLLIGQANFIVLAFTVLGLTLVEKRPWLAGALLGVACMAKMSPALFVASWLLQRRFPPVLAACATAVVLSVLALPLVGYHDQLRFYTEILPGFGTGDYNGLTIPITMYGNHSLPNLYAQVFPGGSSLSGTARMLTTGSSLVLVAGTFGLFRGVGGDIRAQAAALGVLTLLLPVYTYEHHLIWALPAVVVAGNALAMGSLDRKWAVPLGLAIAVWAADLATLKGFSTALNSYAAPLGWLVQEAKCASLITLFFATLTLGRGK